METTAPQYKAIYLTQGRFALVDLSQSNRVNQFKWRFQPKNPGDSNGYAVRDTRLNGTRKKIYMHRFILSCPPGVVVDHVDGDGLNNIEINLRQASVQENVVNKYIPGGTSKYKGVHREKQSKKWRSKIGFQKKTIHLGVFKCEVEAAKSYDKKAFELFGNFAVLNFPDDFDLLPPF